MPALTDRNFWRLATAEGRPFGDRLWCDITVQASTSSLSSSSIIAPSLNASGKAESPPHSLAAEDKAPSAPDSLTSVSVAPSTAAFSEHEGAFAERVGEVEEYESGSESGASELSGAGAGEGEGSDGEFIVLSEEEEGAGDDFDFSSDEEM